MKKSGITIRVNDEELDATLEKANRLKVLLTEIHELICSLCSTRKVSESLAENSKKITHRE